MGITDSTPAEESEEHKQADRVFDKLLATRQRIRNARGKSPRSPKAATVTERQVSVTRYLDVQKGRHLSQQKLSALLEEYDKDKSKKLDLQQVVQLLTDLDITTPPDTPPSDDERDFIMKISDSDGDGALSLGELERATRVWQIYTNKRKEMELALKKFDVSRTGSLNKAELKQYLISLNDGQAVSDEEVQWVFSEADILKDGAVHATELIMATAAWYAHVDEEDFKARFKTTLSLVRAAVSKPGGGCLPCS